MSGLRRGGRWAIESGVSVVGQEPTGGIAGANDSCYRIGDCGVGASNARDVRAVNDQA